MFGRSEALCSGLNYHLSFLDHVHELDPNKGVLGCLERFEPRHRPDHSCHCSMIWLDTMVHIFHLADAAGGAILLVVALDGGFVGVTAVDGARLGNTMATDRLLQKAQGGLFSRGAP